MAGVLLPLGARADDRTPEARAQPATAQAADPNAPQDKHEAARLHFDRGIEFFGDGAFDAALGEFDRAYQLAPTYKLLYNIGQAQRARNDYAGALLAFEKYLSEGGKQIADTRKAEVEKALEGLRARVASIQVATPNAGSEILVDDVVVGRSPLAKPVVVNPGRRKVSATFPGSLPSTEVIMVVSGEAVKVDLSPVSFQGPAAAPEVDTGPRTRAYVAWGATALVGIATGVAGGLTLSSSKQLETLRNTPGTTAGDLESEKTKVLTGGVVTDVLLGLTIVSAGFATYFTVKAVQAGSKSAPPPAKASLDLGPGSMRFAGTF